MIAIIGLGTLGSRLAHLLKEESLALIDHDVVYEENLEIQKYTRRDIGTQKVYAIMRLIPSIRAHNVFLDETNIELLREAEVVIDCTDNLVTRRLLGKYCYDEGIPFIHAAAGKKRGIVGLFVGKHCFACAYKNKIAVDTCRGREIPVELADKLVLKQARLTAQVLAGEEKPFLQLLTVEDEQIITFSACSACEEELPREEFYITWCTLASTMSAKPLKKRLLRAETTTRKGTRCVVFENGEIHYYGEEDIDKLKVLTQELYATHTLPRTDS
ncbi:MAG: HesA/MoeB/ThiF family protein [Candidatus Woesearchaeota archaeon]